jgi:sulfate/thiosulfate transport system permease protein
VASPSAAPALPTPRRRLKLPVGGVLAGGSLLWLSILVLLPIAAIFSKAFEGGFSTFWNEVTAPESIATLKFTLAISAIVCVIGACMGLVVAWVFVRDDFRGKRLLEGLVDLPFALPTIVAGLTLLALYGPAGDLGINVAYTRVGVGLALLFVTLPFGVRAVQPVLMELDPEVEAAAASLGAKQRTILRRIILPSLRPAILSGMALAFARALGEFGAVVLISGNIPFHTEYASFYIFSQLESGTPQSAAAAATALLILSLIVLLALEFFERRAARHAG